jgi:hypothetical protein
VCPISGDRTFYIGGVQLMALGLAGDRAPSAGAELEAGRKRLRKLRRKLNRRRDRLSEQQRSLDTPAAALDAREDELTAGP